MSALQYLRDKAGVLVAGVIGLSLFIFVVSDFFGGGRSQRIRQRRYYEIGEIGKNKISYQEYQQRVENLQEIYKLSGTSNIDEATLENIREQVWMQMERELLLDVQYKDLGIGVSSEEVEDMVLGNEPHAIVRQLFTDNQTGFFNKSFLVNFLKSTEVDETAKRYWLFFENEIVTERMNSKYNNLVIKGLYVTSKQAEFDGETSRNTVDFSFLVKGYTSVADSSVTVSESDIHSYYSKHKSNYNMTAQRDIEYVSFDITPSEEDFSQALTWITNAREEFATTDDPVQYINSSSDTRYVGFYYPLSEVPDTLKEFARAENKNVVFGPYLEDGSYKLAKLIDVADRPDSVHARHILISPTTGSSIQQAKATADSLVNVIKAGSPFEVLALTMSDDQGSSQLGGDLGWFSEGQMVVPFNNACFSSNKGDLKVVETNYGVHVIEILDISKKVRKYDIGIIDRKVVAGSVTNQKIYAEASQFASNNDNYDKFNRAVAEQKLDKRIASNVTPQQKTLPGLDNPRYLIMSLFQSEEGKIILDNNNQAIFEIGDKYVVAYCTGITEEGPAPLEDVENDIRYILIREKKADVIAAKLEQDVESGNTLDEIASDEGTQVQEATQINFSSYSVPGAGVEPALIAASTVAEPGIVSGPVKGNNGVFLLTVNSKTEANAEDIELLKGRLTSTFQMRGTYEAYEAIRKKANIIDRRYKFY